MSCGVNDNLWAGAFDAETHDSADGVIPFFERQCKSIEESSGGKVRARFKKLEIVEKQTGAGVGALTAVALAASIAGGTVREEKDALELEDANDFYNPSDYVFDVYSNKYKFRVLTMELGMVYPVSCELDTGIAEELKDDLERFADPINQVEGLWLHDDGELESFIGLLVSRSRKLRAILVKMAME